MGVEARVGPAATAPVLTSRLMLAMTATLLGHVLDLCLMLAVLAYHADLPGITGGFVGVDVFFVISGYLITGLLLKEREQSGRIDLANFYARRLKRLLPALVAT